MFNSSAARYNAELVALWRIAGITPRDLSIKVVDRFRALFNLFDELLLHLQDSPTLAGDCAV
jgi:hypothetical protein